MMNTNSNLLNSINANAFTLTFAYAQRTSHDSKSKRECKPTHTTVHLSKCVRIRDDNALKDRAAANKVLPKAGLTCFYDTFVLNRTLAFQINSSAEMPRLRQYPNRYRQV